MTVRFNPAEPDVFASTATDRNIVLYDLRGATPVRKLIMTVRRFFFTLLLSVISLSLYYIACSLVVALTLWLPSVQMRTNALCWNPMEPFNFTTASEDHNCYTFDMRKLDRALNVHQDHVSAVYARPPPHPSCCSCSCSCSCSCCWRCVLGHAE